MLIGSGLKGQGGTALVYKSRSLLQGARPACGRRAWLRPGPPACMRCPAAPSGREAGRARMVPRRACSHAAHAAPTPSPARAGWELEGTLCEASNTDTGVVWCALEQGAGPAGGLLGAWPRGLMAPCTRPAQRLPPHTLTRPLPCAASPSLPRECPLLVPLDPVPRALRAIGRREPPRWLRAPLDRAGSGSESGTASGTFGSFDQPDGGAPSGSTPHLEGAAYAALAAAAPAGSSGEAATAADQAGEAAGGAPGFAFSPHHRRADSFAFDEAPSGLHDSHMEAAASAVQAWQQQPAEAAPAAEAPAPDPDAPSDAAALPPGLRGRRPVEGAHLPLQSAATLEDWSQPTSEQPSPEPSQSNAASSAASPEKGSPAPPALAAAARPRPPLLHLAGPGAGPGAQAQPRQQQGQQGQQGQGQAEGEEEEDRFAAAFSRLSMRGIRPRKRSGDRGASRRGSQAVLAGGGEDEAGAPDTPPPPERQWHFFTSGWMGEWWEREAACLWRRRRAVPAPCDPSQRPAASSAGSPACRPGARPSL